MPPDRRTGRRDEDRAWQLLVGQVTELRNDVGDLAEDVAELINWKANTEDQLRLRGRKVIERRNAVVFWIGLTTGLGGLVLAVASFVIAHA